MWYIQWFFLIFFTEVQCIYTLNILVCALICISCFCLALYMYFFVTYLLTWACMHVCLELWYPELLDLACLSLPLLFLAVLLCRICILTRRMDFSPKPASFANFWWLLSFLSSLFCCCLSWTYSVHPSCMLTGVVMVIRYFGWLEIYFDPLCISGTGLDEPPPLAPSSWLISTLVVGWGSPWYNVWRNQYERLAASSVRRSVESLPWSGITGMWGSDTRGRGLSLPVSHGTDCPVSTTDFRNLSNTSPGNAVLFFTCVSVVPELKLIWETVSSWESNHFLHDFRIIVFEFWCERLIIVYLWTLQNPYALYLLDTWWCGGM